MLPRGYAIFVIVLKTFPFFESLQDGCDLPRNMFGNDSK